MEQQPRRALAYQVTAAQPEALQITGCRVVSTTNPLSRYSWFSRPGPLSHRQIAPQLFLRRLSRPRTSPQIQVKIPDLAGNRTRGLRVTGRYATPTLRGFILALTPKYPHNHMKRSITFIYNRIYVITPIYIFPYIETYVFTV